MSVLTLMSIYTEIIPGHGEDASPLCEQLDRGVLLGVFDGLGGAGSRKYTVNNTTKSGAYYASHLVHDAVNTFFKQPHHIQSVDKHSINRSVRNELVPKLKKLIVSTLKEWLKKNEQGLPNLKSSLIKRLPTTAAVVYLFSGQAVDFNHLSSEEVMDLSPGLDLHSLFLWSGDSRGYMLDPVNGLMQCTHDDLRSGGDAWENLWDDSPMSNYINADSDFSLNFYIKPMYNKSILFSATDGCFGYLKSPMHFEYLLLSTMNNAASMTLWESLLTTEIKSATSDDATLSLAAIGWNDFAELKKDFKERLKYISQEYIKPCEQLLQNQEKNSIKDLWKQYKSGYEAYEIPELVLKTNSVPSLITKVETNSMQKPITTVPIVITSIYVGNSDAAGQWIHKPGEKLNASEMRYLKTVITYHSKVNTDITLYVKVLTPDGGLISHPFVSPSGYSFSETRNINRSENLYWDFRGCGRPDRSIYRPGDYRVEIWYENICVGYTTVTLNEIAFNSYEQDT
ncbi:MAG: hypothetical protein LBQ77_02750 [Treponema sp.]|jgi:hypothetical protein|nr:hypothetical protein [Treponema sp.]